MEDITCKGMPPTRGTTSPNEAAMFVAVQLNQSRSDAKATLRDAYTRGAIHGWWPEPAEGCWDHPQAWLRVGEVHAWVRQMQGQQQRAGRGGANWAADFEAIYEGPFLKMFDKYGKPERRHGKGWEFISDVEKLIAKAAEDDGDSPSETTLKEWARKFLRYAAEGRRSIT